VGDPASLRALKALRSGPLGPRLLRSLAWVLRALETAAMATSGGGTDGSEGCEPPLKLLVGVGGGVVVVVWVTVDGEHPRAGRCLCVRCAALCCDDPRLALPTKVGPSSCGACLVCVLKL
jgi:hypothetical protein